MTVPIRPLPGVAASLLLTACLPFHVPDPPPLRPEVVGQQVSRADALADIDTLMRVLEDVHPNLYAVRSRDSATAELSQVVASLPATESRVELWTRLARFVNRFGDGHTTIYLPGEELQRMQEGATLFPANVTLDPDGHLVTTAVVAGGEGLRRGDRLVSINGHDADSLLHDWMLEFSGENPAFRAANVAGGFRALALIHGISAPYTIDVVGVDSARRSVVVKGILRDSLRAVVATATARQGGRVPQTISYSRLQPGVGYLNIRAFDARPDQFADRLKVLLTQVTADSDRALLIDLRTNPGGDSRLADELLQHLTTTAYRMGARKDWKMSAEYRAYLRTFISPPLRWMRVWAVVPQARAMMNGPDGKVVTEIEQAESHGRAEPFFAGNVCFLIGPGTFSTASDLADAVKTYHLATLVGDETGGRVNTFGEAYPFRLPKSQLLGQVSSAYFVRSSGDTTDQRGVVPDVLVRPTAEDRAKGRDAVMEAAELRCGRGFGG